MRKLQGLLWSVSIAALGAVGVCRADAPAAPDPVVVTADKLVPDEVVTQRVETAFDADKYFYGTQVHVRTRNGVVYLDGSVWDDWDMRAVLRIARHIPGVKRVVNNLDIGPDGS
jgi:hyperosmotically inducible periplasmic protein